MKTIGKPSERFPRQLEQPTESKLFTQVLQRPLRPLPPLQIQQAGAPLHPGQMTPSSTREPTPTPTLWSFLSLNLKQRQLHWQLQHLRQG